MTRSEVLHGIESGFYKILIQNDKIKTSDSREFHVKHLYLVGFKNAQLKIEPNGIYGEISYDSEPQLDLLGEVLSIVNGSEPEIRQDFINETVSSKKQELITGYSTPFILKVNEDKTFFTIINNKYYTRSDSIELSINTENSGILNILIYPMKILWTYLPRARFKIELNRNHASIRVSSP
ncbi:MAG: hypothetical protein ABWW65_03410 [Thermoprotei archaeon]